MIRKLTNVELLDHMYGIRNELKTEIHSVKYGLSMRIDALEQRFDGIDQRFDRIEAILIELRDSRIADQKRFERIERHVGLAV